MSVEETARVTNEFFRLVEARAAADQIAALFSEDLDFAIQGDVGALPWIGARSGRRAISEFFRDAPLLFEWIRFDLRDLLFKGDVSVAVGELVSRFFRTGRTAATEFAIVMTVSSGKIVRFHMLEDSFAVSKAARGWDTTGGTEEARG